MHIRRTNAPASGSRRETGQALVELALVTPILVVLLMAIFQFAFVLETQMGLTNAVREAARRAAAVSDPTELWVREQLCGVDVAECNGGLLGGDPGDPGDPASAIPGVPAFSASRLEPAPITIDGMLYSTNPGVRVCMYMVNDVPNYRIDVVVKYAHPVFFPLLGYATDVADGVSDGSWTLSAQAQMRLERDPSSAPGDSC